MLGENEIQPNEVADKPVTGLDESVSELQEHLRLKRRKIKVAGAPKMPLNGYLRYMNDRRENVRKENPNKTSLEHTRMISDEWQKLSADRKTPYIEAAENDKQRYDTELHEFLKSNPDILASELAKIKAAKSTTNEDANKQKKNPPPQPQQQPPPAVTPPTTTTTTTDNLVVAKPASPINTFSLQNTANNENYNNNNSTTTTNTVPFMQGEIPIFTNEFLEHNKAFDMELRTLRKTKTDLEQQNAVLEKHVDNMKSGVKKLSDENAQLNEKNRLLQIYLDKIKQKLSKALAGVSIPGEPDGATLENIEKYMSELALMTNATNAPSTCSLNKAKDIIRKLDLQIQL